MDREVIKRLEFLVKLILCRIWIFWILIILNMMIIVFFKMGVGMMVVRVLVFGNKFSKIKRKVV